VSGRTLVAGVGNILQGDDGFGVAVARRLAGAALPAGAEAADFGVRGLHLAVQLLDGYDTLILVDALARGGVPGTLYVLEATPGAPAPGVLDAHGADPATVLALLERLGGRVGRVLVVGCEPADLSEQLGLTPIVEQAVVEAERVVRRLLERPSQEEPPCSAS
jgi:hydrogenase maturation protease